MSGDWLASVDDFNKLAADGVVELEELGVPDEVEDRLIDGSIEGDGTTQAKITITQPSLYEERYVIIAIVAVSIAFLVLFIAGFMLSTQN